MADKSARPPPRYREILATLKMRIADGRYPVGTNLPSEIELAKEFSASRFTVREALRRLQADGVLQRHQGAGSKVLRTGGDGAFVQTYETLDELQQFAEETDFRLLSVAEATLSADIAATLNAEAGETWTLLSGLRLEPRSGRRLALIESYVPPRFAAHVGILAKSKPPFFSQLEAETGETVTSALQSVEALKMPAAVSRALAVAPATVSLRLMRRYESRQGTVIASFNWHLGGSHFVYRSRLQRRSAQ